MRSERLHLRPLEKGDAGRLFAIFSNPRVMRYWSSGPWSDVQVARQYIEDELRAMRAGEHIRLAIVRLEDGLLLGTCTLYDLNAQCRRAEIGYALAPDAWGQGYMQEALKAL